MKKQTAEQGPETQAPAWLVRIQENSWEPEIILSGLVLFSLIKAPELLRNLRIYLSQEILGFGDFWYVEAAGQTAVQFLTWGFLIHLVMRGIWIGFVGLSYVFPRGIDPARLGFQRRFARGLEQRWTIPSILRMERACSTTFSIALMTFLLVAGTALFYLCYNWLLFRLLNYIGTPRLAVSAIYLVLKSAVVLFFIDFFTVGGLRRLPWVAAIFYPVYQVLRWPLLTVTYEKIYLTLVANTNRVWLSILLIALAGVGWLSFRNRVTALRYPGPQEITAGSYDNLRPPNRRIDRAAIQKDVIDGKTIRLFVAHDMRMVTAMSNHCGIDKNDLAEALESRHAGLGDCLSRFIEVYLDGARVDHVTWYYHRRAATRDRGYLTWLDIADQPRGAHQLTIRLAENPANHNGDWWTIPYYRE